MKIIIEHRKTKRIIDGPFSLCCGRNELIELKSILDEKLSNDFIFGWIYFDEYIKSPVESEFDLIKRQKTLSDTLPVSWDIVGLKQFAADLKARIEIVTKGRPYFRLYPKEVFSFIDETLNAEHPTPEQIREIEREELP